MCRTNMKNKNIFILLTFIVLSVTMSSAQVNTFIVNEPMNITVVCVNAGFCSASANCTINVQRQLDSVIVIEGGAMTYNPTIFNYTYTPVTIGKYNVGGVCIDGVYSEKIDYSFEVTNNGDDLTTGSSMMYLVMLLFSVILFCFTFYWMIELKFGNFFDYNTGDLVGRNDWKYLKLFLIPVNYVLLMWIFGIARSIAANYLFLPGLGLVFNWAYWVMLSFAFPALIVSLFFLIIMVINDKRINEALKRGSPYNGP